MMLVGGECIVDEQNIPCSRTQAFYVETADLITLISIAMDWKQIPRLALLARSTIPHCIAWRQGQIISSKQTHSQFSKALATKRESKTKQRAAERYCGYTQSRHLACCIHLAGVPRHLKTPIPDILCCTTARSSRVSRCTNFSCNDHRERSRKFKLDLGYM
jgi:hypothetical protein